MTYDGWGSHIHSHDTDPGDEILAMWNEVRAAAHCRTVVHAGSAFMWVLLAEYHLSERELPEMIFVDTNVPKEEVMDFPGTDEHDRARTMMDAIFREAEEEYQKRKLSLEGKG